MRNGNRYAAGTNPADRPTEGPFSASLQIEQDTQSTGRNTVAVPSARNDDLPSRCRARWWANPYSHAEDPRLCATNQRLPARR
uniref:Uncharacterized protein n=1 Tax=blood disease bacterium R229 TaxID=741978 RepID=G2ZQ69_9RALS|nr:conserved hypothetical protein [blood disease bacterium R229]